MIITFIKYIIFPIFQTRSSYQIHTYCFYRVKIAQGAVVCLECELKGDISIGMNHLFIFGFAGVLLSKS